MATIPKDLRARFRYFVLAREEAREHKEWIGGPPPHSQDPIIAQTRFCNVNREDDTVTRWIKQNVRDCYELQGKDFLVPQVLASRIFNHPPTLERILPVQNAARAIATLKKMRLHGEQRLRGAYLVAVHGPKGKGIRVEDYYVPTICHAASLDWESRECKTLAGVAAQLCRLEGVNRFFANQVCTDLRYTTHWKDAPDWETFVLGGPGTGRGLDRYDGCYKGKHVGRRNPKIYSRRVLEVREELRQEKFPLVHLFRDPNNLSNCFCEWDKYERILQGESSRLHHYP